MRKTLIAVVACALAASLGVARGNTIQPICTGMSGGSGSYTYTIDFELTPNNYLKDVNADPVSYPSSVTILDVGHISSASILSTTSGRAGANATVPTDWQMAYTQTTGEGGLLPNYDGSTPNVFTLLGSSDGLKASEADDPNLNNVTLKYVGAGLDSSDFSQRSLIQIQITTDLAPGNIVYSVDTDGNPNTGVQQVDTYSLRVPEPAALTVALLGCAGLLLRRRRA